LIRPLSGLPEGIIGFEVSGRVTAEDFRDMVLPAVEKAAWPRGALVAAGSCGDAIPYPLLRDEHDHSDDDQDRHVEEQLQK
jgi:hypothetical protein